MRNFRRGEVYYIENSFRVSGQEQRPGRPAIIISNDKCNEHSTVLEVVYLTAQPKVDLPTHVLIKSTKKDSTALCEQIHSVSIDRIGDRVTQITEDEMSQINQALLISIDLLPNSNAVAEQPDESLLPTNVAKLKKELEIYKALYEQLLERLIPATKFRNEI
jgi:mRNA interferase MazF